MLLILTKIKNNKLTKLSPVKEEILVNDPPKKRKRKKIKMIFISLQFIFLAYFKVVLSRSHFPLKKYILSRISQLSIF